MPGSVVGGRLTAPHPRELRALLRPCSVPFRCRFSCPFLPCWIHPTWFFSTLERVLMTGLTHLLWSDPTPSATSSLYAAQPHLSLCPRWTPVRQAGPLLSTGAFHHGGMYMDGWENICTSRFGFCYFAVSGEDLLTCTFLVLGLDVSSVDLLFHLRVDWACRTGRCRTVKPIVISSPVNGYGDL